MIKKRIVKRYLGGQSLVELLMALFVVALVVVAVVGVSTASVRNSSFAKNSSEARRYAEEAMEWLRQRRDEKWQTFRAKAGNPNNTKIYCLDVLPVDNTGQWNSNVNQGCDNIPNTNFIRKVELVKGTATGETPDPNIETDDVVYAKVSVTWTDSQGSHDIALTTQLYNINQ